MPRLPFRVMQPWGPDKGRQASLISEHATAADAFREIDRLSPRHRSPGTARRPRHGRKAMACQRRETAPYALTRPHRRGLTPAHEPNAGPTGGTAAGAWLVTSAFFFENSDADVLPWCGATLEYWGRLNPLSDSASRPAKTKLRLQNCNRRPTLLTHPTRVPLAAVREDCPAIPSGTRLAVGDNESAPGHGTLIRVTLPVRGSEEGA